MKISLLSAVWSFFGIAVSSSKSKARVHYSVSCPKDPKLREMIKSTSDEDDFLIQCANPRSEYLFKPMREDELNQSQFAKYKFDVNSQ